MNAFRTVVPVRFGDVDRAGVLYYPRLFHVLHTAFEDFFARGVGVPYPELLEVGHAGFPTVRAECDFTAPFRYGDAAEVHVAVEAVGGSSATFLYVVVNRRLGKPAARARITVACVDMRTFKSREIPPALKSAFLRWMVPAKKRK
jgi:4-hydroxybenzoyl-CoA thioesterase